MQFTMLHNSLGFWIEKFSPRLSKFYTVEEMRRLLSYKLEDMELPHPAYPGWNSDLELSHENFAKLLTFGEALATGMPYQYILGYAFFDKMRLSVAPGVLIPRPETEELLHYIRLTLADSMDAYFSTILDLCTGSGALALGLAKSWPQSELWGIDISNEALSIARLNASQLLPDARINFLQQDLFSSSAAIFSLLSRANLIVSNPPYVPMAEFAELDFSVRTYEPLEAILVSSLNPFAFYLRIIELADRFSAPGRHLFFECHSANAQALLQLLKNKFGMFYSIHLQNDLNNAPRFLHLQHHN